ncbi:MAG: crotonobetainyl-CoA:carnitine CoA-transferase CaiB-like acyl-CoA transferase [Candidatus Poriferisodalaceae bacterium]|jgi:crotonobetainyl-CoA:carnitine CoA-transferase CaiB-like acyl-CoA transferase
MPLSHYRVLDLTDDRGQFAGCLLAQLGADVICVEPPDGHRSRRMAPFIDDEPDNDRSLFHWAYNRGKRSVVVDAEQLLDLVRGADAVITCGAYDVDLEAMRLENSALVTATISPFGSDGPKAHWLGTDLTNFAAGGVMSVTGDRDRPPIRVSHPQSWLAASSDAAVGVLVALRERARSGLGQHVDVSAQQAAISMTQFSMMNSLVGAPEALRIAGGLELGPFKLRFVFECSDGHVNVTYLFGPVIGPYSNRLFKWMHDEGECPDDLAERDWIPYAMDVFEGRVGMDVMERATEVIEAFIAKRSKAELFQQSIERGALIAPITTTRDLLDLEHLRVRDYWSSIQVPGRSTPVDVPGPFAKLSASPLRELQRPPSIGEHTAELIAEPRRSPAVSGLSAGLRLPDDEASTRPLAGLKVLDLFWALAGPGATRTLADFGATVVRVESETRPELLRAANPFRGEAGDTEGSLQYHSPNAGKMQLQLNLAVPESWEVLLDMVRWADVVTESFTPRATRKMGLTYEALRVVNPKLIMVSSCLMGHSGPLSDYPGFGTAGASMAGFYPITGWPDRLPAGPYVAYTDYTSPRFTVAAILAAVEHLEHTGEGQHIDFSQMEAALHMTAPLFLDDELHGRTATRNGNADPAMAPHVVVPTAPEGGDRWIAIACENDEQWATLAALMGRDDLSSLRLDERLDRRVELEQILGAWTASQEPLTLQEILQSHGVPAHQVQNSTECVADPQLIHREQFRTVPHQTYGDSFVEGPAFTLSRSDYGPLWAGPTLGQHTFEVLTEFLGYDGDKVADIVAAGCIE